MRPFVTVVLPIRNEAGSIEHSLGALLHQDYPADRMEILVLDGMSDDATRDIIRGMLRPDRAVAVRVLDNPGRIVPVAMNIALDHARGDVIVRVDGHTVVASDYVRACVDSLQANEADCVGGPMVARGHGPFGEAVALATSHPLGVGGARFHYASRVMETDTAYMGAWRRDVFAWAGEFDEEMACNEDDEFSYRLRGKGGRIVLDPSIRSVYLQPLDRPVAVAPVLPLRAVEGAGGAEGPAPDAPAPRHSLRVRGCPCRRCSAGAVRRPRRVGVAHHGRRLRGRDRSARA